MRVTVDENNIVKMDVWAEQNCKIQAVLRLTVFDGMGVDRPIKLEVKVHGKGEQGVQTMWNAVDAWVKKSSHFRSLIELYGHFTGSHPIFTVDSFENQTNLPIFKFAEHCMDFKNCSVYFEKEQLLEMWGDEFCQDNFA